MGDRARKFFCSLVVAVSLLVTARAEAGFIDKLRNCFAKVAEAFAAPELPLTEKEKALVAESEKKTTPRNHPYRYGFLDKQFTVDGVEYVFTGHPVTATGKVLYVGNFTVKPRDTSDIRDQRPMGVAELQKAYKVIMDEARTAGFEVVVLTADRVTGARYENRLKALREKRIERGEEITKETDEIDSRIASQNALTKVIDLSKHAPPLEPAQVRPPR